MENNIQELQLSSPIVGREDENIDADASNEPINHTDTGGSGFESETNNVDQELSVSDNKSCSGECVDSPEQLEHFGEENFKEVSEEPSRKISSSPSEDNSRLIIFVALEGPMCKKLGGKIGCSKRLIRFVPVRSPIVTSSRSNTMESAGNNSSAHPPPNMTEYASVTELNQVNEKLDRLTQMFMNFMQNQNQSNQDHPNYILVPDQPQAPPDQPQGQANPTGPSSSTNIRSLPPKQTVIFHTSGQQEDDTYEEEEWRSKGKQKADMSDQIAQLKLELRSELRSEVRQLKGVDTYGKIDLEDLCLHPGSKMPPKFKCPELSKYNGKGCPLAHLKLYIGSLSDFIDNEPLLLQLFQRSLTEEALDWYSTIDHTKLKVWRDLAEVFLDHFRFNTTDVANRMDVQRMYKKSTETFSSKLADYEYLHNMFEQQTAANATTKRPVNGRRDNGKKKGMFQTVMVNRPQNSYAQPMYTQTILPDMVTPSTNYPVYAQLFLSLPMPKQFSQLNLRLYRLLALPV
ncbi:hypothetical protein HHK36_028142 [Tetracentron sinense]|uniref:Retrotransposon gag domain-containing protein n=1 Tax=Tetracentron sinense TaxID=13715 RepID=A0A835D1U9_TETSI|nr:hypothetical protein HHK36_028142 [Tetracentron sinense]